MIRGILIAATVIIDLVLSIPLIIVVMLLQLTPLREQSRRFTFRVAQKAIAFLKLECGARMKVTGLDRIPKDTAVLYVGNHNSYFDIILTYYLLPDMTGYISKKDLMYVPLLNLWMKMTHCLFLDRKDVKAGLRMINEAIENIRLGSSMFIFPEGTRNKTGDERNLAPMKDGSFKIAERTLCPIVPVAITGTAKLFEEHMPFVKAGDVTVEFGEPIYPEKFDPKERKHMGGIVSDRILEMIKKEKEN